MKLVWWCTVHEVLSVDCWYSVFCVLYLGFNCCFSGVTESKWGNDIIMDFMEGKTFIYIKVYYFVRNEKINIFADYNIE